MLLGRRGLAYSILMQQNIQQGRKTLRRQLRVQAEFPVKLISGIDDLLGYFVLFLGFDILGGFAAWRARSQCLTQRRQDAKSFRKTIYNPVYAVANQCRSKVDKQSKPGISQSEICQELFGFYVLIHCFDTLGAFASLREILTPDLRPPVSNLGAFASWREIITQRR
jgi:hypothetical protein